MDTTRASLLLRIRDRSDTVAWRQFDTIYRPMLMRFAKSRGLDHAGAEDVTQHCMAAVSKYIDRFDYDPRKGRFKDWLRTLIHNRICDVHRRPAERPAPSGVLAAVQADEASPEELFDRIWREEHLKQCLRLVRSDVEASTIRAFEMYALEQRPIEEVCRSLDMTANQVHAIKSRLTKKLRATMKGLLDAAE